MDMTMPGLHPPHCDPQWLARFFCTGCSCVRVLSTIGKGEEEGGGGGRGGRWEKRIKGELGKGKRRVCVCVCVRVRVRCGEGGNATHNKKKTKGSGGQKEEGVQEQHQHQDVGRRSVTFRCPQQL